MIDPLEELVYWYRTEFRERTRLLARGEGKIEWIDAGTRVSFSEMVEKAEQLGVDLDVVGLRLALDERLSLGTSS